MTILARKTNRSLLILADLLLGILILLAAVIVLPIGIFSIDKSLLTNGFVWLTVLILMLVFGSTGFFCFLRPFLLFCRLPEVQAETDGTYLYIHSTKEAKIPLADMGSASVEATVPYMMSHEFIIHLISERYGDVIIKVPGYGKYRLRYISQAQEVPDVIMELAGITPDFT